MAIQAGKSTVVKVSPTAGGAGTYTIVASVKSATMSLAGATLDTTAFVTGGASLVSRILGLKDASYSLSGFWDSGDTNGQLAIRNSLINDSVLWIQFMPDGTTGFKQQVIVSKFDISDAVDGMAEVSIELQGTSTITAF
jgi:predicted secreted protein